MSNYEYKTTETTSLHRNEIALRILVAVYSRETNNFDTVAKTIKSAFYVADEFIKQANSETGDGEND